MKVLLRLYAWIEKVRDFIGPNWVYWILVAFPLVFIAISFLLWAIIHPSEAIGYIYATYVSYTRTYL